MSGSQEIQQCIDHCNQLANQLRTMSKNSQDRKMSDLLFEGAHHIDLCVTECSYSVQKAKQQVGATAMV